MHELVAILITGAIGMSVSYGFMFLLKVKPSKETSADAWIEGYIIDQFLSFIDRCIEDDPSLVVPADEEQLKRLAKILGIAIQGIEPYSEGLSQLA